MRSMMMFCCSVLCLLAANHFSTVVSKTDPCIENQKLTNWWRSTAYENDDIAHKNICDRDLQEGWYRADTKAGGDMPTSAQGFKRCGTVYPIWLKGELPTAGAQVSRKACVPGIFIDCSVQLDIEIKNCGTFNVYKLQPTTSCPEAYCFGSERMCPPGVTSSNGFTPGCNLTTPPTLTETPTLTAVLKPLTELKANQVVFECNIQTDQDIAFDFKFMIGEKVVYIVNDVVKGNLPAALPETKFRDFQDPATHLPNLGYGNELTCIVQGKWEIGDNGGEPTTISKYFGFEIINTLPIQMGDGDETDLKIRSNLPISCPSINPDCGITVELHAPAYVSNFLLCPADKPAPIVLGRTGCSITIKAADWDKVNVMKIKASTDPAFGKGTRSMVATLFADLQGHQPSLSNVKLPPVQISIIDRGDLVGGMQCRAVCDPHMGRFDKLRWEGQRIGEFILYLNKKYNTEVQIRLARCNGAATCICAIMIRSGRSLYIIDTCGVRNVNVQYTLRQPPRFKMYDCDEGRGEMIIQKVGNRYTFTLATQTVVIFYYMAWRGFHNMYITPSVEDFQNTDGLCGHIHAARASQFRLRSGVVTTDAIQMMLDWQTTPEERLWSGKSTTPALPVYYCGCEDGAISCDASVEHANCVDQFFTNQQLTKCHDSLRRRRKRSLKIAVRDAGFLDDDEDLEIDFEDEPLVVQNPGWRDGWTFEKAKAFCEDYILLRDSVKACEDVPDVDTQASIDLCILDIELTAETTASATHVGTIKAECEMAASRNLSLWKVAENNTVTPPAQILEANCPAECNDRGDCVAGVCKCNDGYSGMDCGIDDAAVPTLYKLPYKGLCDLSQWSCEFTLAFGDDLKDKKTLTSRVIQKQLTTNGIVVGATKDNLAELDRPEAAVCKLETYETVSEQLASDNKVLGFVYDIQFSNDGTTFSDALTMVAYDSQCSTCTNTNYTDVACLPKDDVCRIQGVCSKDKEYHPSQNCAKCDMDKSSTEWTIEEGKCFINDVCYDDGDLNPTNKHESCKLSESSTEWTLTEVRSKCEQVETIPPPTCDENGNYVRKQCNKKKCWCVEPESGENIYAQMIPLGEKYDCKRKPKKCQRKRFKAIRKERRYIPTCNKSGNFTQKQCIEQDDTIECFCVKARTGKWLDNTDCLN